MNARLINQAMLNRANMQYEIKDINNRINDIVNRINGIDTTNPVNGVDVEFTINENITSAVLNDILSKTGFEWINAGKIAGAKVYEAPAPSSYINNLRPSGMWKSHVVDNNGDFIADTYSPLESFVRNADDSIMFSLIQPGTTAPAEKNYGGNLPAAIMELVSSSMTTEAIQSMVLNIASSEFLNLDNLYFIQNTDLISENFGGGTAESFTLHFE